jgi:hypothetical protein
MCVREGAISVNSLQAECVRTYHHSFVNVSVQERARGRGMQARCVLKCTMCQSVCVCVCVIYITALYVGACRSKRGVYDKIQCANMCMCDLHHSFVCWCVQEQARCV